MATAIKEILSEAGINRKIIRSDFLNFKFDESLCQNEDDELFSSVNYEYSYRKTAKQLTDDFIKEIKYHQRKYNENLESCREIFSNIHDALNMNAKFKEADGVSNVLHADCGKNSSEDEFNVSSVQKDTISICSIIGCSKRQQKLRLHLVTIHPKLKLENIKYALLMGNHFAANKRKSAPTSNPTPSHKVSKQINLHRVTNFFHVKKNTNNVPYVNAW